jgi:hypothetical protein
MFIDQHISPGLVRLQAPGTFHFEAGGYVIDGVRTIEEIRHANMLLILAELAAQHGEHGAIQRLAAAMGRSHSQLSQLKTRAVHSKTGKPRNIGNGTARLMEGAVGKPRGWLDAAHDDESMQDTLARLISAELDKRSQQPMPSAATNVAVIQVPPGTVSGMDKTAKQKALRRAAATSTRKGG